MERFGVVLKNARVKAKVSVARLAREIGRSESHLRDVERGTRGPLNADDCRTTAHALGVPTRTLLEAMVRERGHIELQVPPDGPRFDMAVTLLERWDLMRDGKDVAGLELPVP